MAVTITVDGRRHEIPEATAITLTHELRAYADGDRGDCDDPWLAQALATAVEQRLTDPTRGPVVITEPEELNALHRALNATVDELGPGMELYNAVDMARRAS